MLLNKKILERNAKINEYDKKPICIDILIDDMISSICFIPKTVTIGPNVYSDIEINDISECIEYYSPLIGGRFMIKKILQNPIFDIEILNKRIELIDSNNLYKIPNILKNNESSLLWLFDNNIEDNELLNIIYFRFSFVNNSSLLLTLYNIYRIFWSPFIGGISPILYFIIPYFIITWKLGINISFWDYLKFSYSSYMMTLPGLRNLYNFFMTLFYFQSLFNSVEISRTINKMCDIIIKKYNKVVIYLKNAINLIKDTDTSLFFNDKLYKYKDELSYVNNLTLIDYTFFGNFGKQLHDYKYINKDIIRSILIKTWYVSALQGIREFRDKHHYCHPCFVEEKNKPIMLVKDLTHPYLNINTVVPNNCKLDDNIIITGPNAGGKSTYIKTISINAILSQTIGVSTSKWCKMTPYYNILTQMNVPDCKGKESLFEAEMNRCMMSLNMLKLYDTNTLIIMDELFNSTNPIEGISGAYAILEEISNYKHCNIVITTHYNYLTKLPYRNYKMNVNIDEEGIITFPYKLSRGISDQYIALELLKINGFDEKIINKAITIKKSFI